MSDAPLLKDSYGPEVPTRIAEWIGEVHPDFDQRAFLASTLDGYADLELMGRARHIAMTLAQYLPPDPGEAIAVLQRSLPIPEQVAAWQSMQAFTLMPYGMFVATHGLDFFEASMQLQYDITKMFTSEFSIRAFIAADSDRTMRRLAEWASDPSEHVRRLVSEGTRPRLPWASRLPMFQADPTPVIELLEYLKDDPSEYVRRSVANNLNDIAKDNPQRTLDVAATWYSTAPTDERRSLVRHGLRTLIKQGNSDALAILGYAHSDAIGIGQVIIEPDQPRIGDSVRINVEIENTSDETVRALVDLEVDFVKANGTTSTKVFKGGELELAPDTRQAIRKSISLRQHTTRKHYPGSHSVRALINGVAVPLGSFELRASD